MCGRYSLTTTAGAIAARFGVEVPANFEPRYNIAPTQEVLVIRRGDGQEKRRIDGLRWGLVPFWAKDRKVGARMINARSETAAKKPAFRAAFRRRRCLIPTDGFYEWVKKDGEKWPIRISVATEEEPPQKLGAFAGLWERWTDDAGEEVESYTILTTDAAPILTELHDRMPVWAPQPFWDAWLEEDDLAEETLEAMIGAFPATRVEFRPVSRKLNKATNEGAELIEEIDEPDLPLRRL